MQWLACPYLASTWIRGLKRLEISRFLHIHAPEVAKMSFKNHSALIVYVVWCALSDAPTPISITCLYLDPWAKNLKNRPISLHSPTRSGQDGLGKIQPPNRTCNLTCPFICRNSHVYGIHVRWSVHRNIWFLRDFHTFMRPKCPRWPWKMSTSWYNVDNISAFQMHQSPCQSHSCGWIRGS